MRLDKKIIGFENFTIYNKLNVIILNEKVVKRVFTAINYS